MAMLFFTFWNGNYLRGQSDFCGFDYYYNPLLQEQDFQDYLDELNQEHLDLIQIFRQGGANFSPVTIPVIVHIVHLAGEAVGTGSNIPASDVTLALANLNSDFAGTNIQFCPAQRDELGNQLVEPGIVRVNGSQVPSYPTNGIKMRSPEEFDIKALGPQFSNYSYLNIWVVNDIESGPNSQIVGFGYFPNTVAPQIDGVTIINSVHPEFPIFGEPGNKVLTHEVGHYLNLRHTFQGDNPSFDGVNLLCPSIDPADGDHIADTDAHIRPNTACPQGDNDCYTPVRPLSNVSPNHMNYTSETCRNDFTAGQIEWMQCTILGLRPGIINSLGCTDGCVNPMDVDFTVDPINPVSFDANGNGGTSGLFTSASTGNQYEWYVNGVLVDQTSSFSFDFTTYGNQIICLRETENSCIIETCEDVLVFPGGICTNGITDQCQELLNGNFEDTNLNSTTIFDVGTDVLSSTPLLSGFPGYIFNRVCNWYNVIGTMNHTFFESSGNQFLGFVDLDGPPVYMTTYEMDLIDGVEYNVQFDLAVVDEDGSGNFQEFYFALGDPSDFPDNAYAPFNSSNLNKISQFFENDLDIVNKVWFNLTQFDFKTYNFSFIYQTGMSKHLIIGEIGSIPEGQDNIYSYIDNISITQCCIVNPGIIVEEVGGCRYRFTGTNTNGSPSVYDWDIESGPSGMDDQSVEFTFSQAGSYTVCLDVACDEEISEQECIIVEVTGECRCDDVPIVVGSPIKCGSSDDYLLEFSIPVDKGFAPCRDQAHFEGIDVTTNSFDIDDSDPLEDILNISISSDQSFAGGVASLVLCGPDGVSKCYLISIGTATECTSCHEYTADLVTCDDPNPFDDINVYSGVVNIDPNIIPGDALPCGTNSSQTGFQSGPLSQNSIPFSISTLNDQPIIGQAILCFDNGLGTYCVKVNYNIPSPCPPPETVCTGGAWLPKPTYDCAIVDGNLEINFTVANEPYTVPNGSVLLRDCNLGAELNAPGNVSIQNLVVGPNNNLVSFNGTITVPCDYEHSVYYYEVRLVLCDEQGVAHCLLFRVWPQCNIDCRVGGRSFEVLKSSPDLFYLYPNPATNNFSIEFSEKGVHEIDLIDNTGRLIFSLEKDLHYTKVDLRKIESGLYFIRVKNTLSNKVEIKKLIKI